MGLYVEPTEKLDVRTAKLVDTDGSKVSKEHFAKVEIAFPKWKCAFTKRRAGRTADA